ncbi:trehalose-6-phosphate synthase [Bradyrhizobium oligotrophicum S58]
MPGRRRRSRTSPPATSADGEIRSEFALPPDVKLIVGIERFDYTKGILDRMRAIDALLTRNPAWRDKLVFVQVAAPTRSKLSSYAKLQAEAELLAAEINHRHKCSHGPVMLIIRHYEQEEVFRLFRAADACIVSSLHDGMNLVAKEFVAARDDNSGVLVLSSFTGASREMSEALIVNPYDTNEMATAIERALTMPADEQVERMKLMRQQVQENNVYRWAGRMLIDAARIRTRERIIGIATGVDGAGGKLIAPAWLHGAYRASAGRRSA